MFVSERNNSTKTTFDVIFENKDMAEGHDHELANHLRRVIIIAARRKNLDLGCEVRLEKERN